VSLLGVRKIKKGRGKVVPFVTRGGPNGDGPVRKNGKVQNGAHGKKKKVKKRKSFQRGKGELSEPEGGGSIY